MCEPHSQGVWGVTKVSTAPARQKPGKMWTHCAKPPRKGICVLFLGQCLCACCSHSSPSPSIHPPPQRHAHASECPSGLRVQVIGLLRRRLSPPLETTQHRVDKGTLCADPQALLSRCELTHDASSTL